MIRMSPDNGLEVRSNPLYTFKFTEKHNLDRDLASVKELRVDMPTATAT